MLKSNIRCQLLAIVALVTFVTKIILLPTKSAAVVGEKDVAGTTELDAAEGALDPFEFLATTVNVYEVPFESPDTYTFVVLPLKTVVDIPLGVAVTMYDVAPEEVVQLTYARLLQPLSAATFVGADGTDISTMTDRQIIIELTHSRFCIQYMILHTKPTIFHRG